MKLYSLPLQCQYAFRGSREMPHFEMRVRVYPSRESFSILQSDFFCIYCNFLECCNVECNDFHSDVYPLNVRLMCMQLVL